MKLHIFQSHDGDCLLLRSAGGRNVLVDGGRRAAYAQFVAPVLGQLCIADEVLDLVYVSHIDQDHIAGILQLLNDAMAWRVFDYQQSRGNTGFRPPDAARPPEIHRIWHNSFHDQVEKNQGPIADLLAARAGALSLAGHLDLAEHDSMLGTSMKEALQVSRRISPRQLNIPLNPEYDGRLMFVTDPVETLRLGDLRIRVIGPFQQELDDLRDEWQVWLDSAAGKRAVADLRSSGERDERELLTSDLDLLRKRIAASLGDRNDVTTPNLASLMLLVEEGSHRVLLTGDGHSDDVEEGLSAAGVLPDNGGLHVDVLKVMHHGALANMMPGFCRRITADHYVFCGDGNHDNPEPEVVQLIIDSRVGPASRRSNNPQTGNRFTLWFNSSSAVTRPARRAHMKKIERLAARAVASSGGKCAANFLDRASFTISL